MADDATQIQMKSALDAYYANYGTVDTTKTAVMKSGKVGAPTIYTYGTASENPNRKGEMIVKPTDEVARMTVDADKGLVNIKALVKSDDGKKDHHVNGTYKTENDPANPTAAATAVTDETDKKAPSYAVDGKPLQEKNTEKYVGGKKVKNSKTPYEQLPTAGQDLIKTFEYPSGTSGKNIMDQGLQDGSKLVRKNAEATTLPKANPVA